MLIRKEPGTVEVTKISAIKPPEKNMRVAAYARVSMDCEALLHSLANQVSYYTDLIRSNPEWEFAGIYTDEGISGTSTEKRDEFNSMMDDARDGKIDIILTKSVSRFARNTVDLLECVRELKELGVEVRFERERISSMTKDGEFFLTLLAAFAQAESESIFQNIKWAKKKRIDAGEATISSACYGYDWDYKERKCIINEEQANWVRYLYKEYLAGASIKGLANELNAKGIKGKRGSLFSRSTVKRILTSETYTGDLILQKTFADGVRKQKDNHGEVRMVLIKDAHEPIISREDYAAVQERINSRAKASPNHGYQKSKYAGLLKCGKCGRAVNLIRRPKHEYDSLECNNRNSGNCDLRPLKASELDEIMNSTIRKSDELSHAVVFDDRVEFHLKNREVRIVQRTILAKKALSGKVYCGYCGSVCRSDTKRDDRIWCCKVRSCDRHACQVKNIKESQLIALAAETLGHPDNINMRIYCDIEKIEVNVETVTYHLKGGESRTWPRK